MLVVKLVAMRFYQRGLFLRSVKGIGVFKGKTFSRACAGGNRCAVTIAIPLCGIGAAQDSRRRLHRPRCRWVRTACRGPPMGELFGPSLLGALSMGSRARGAVGFSELKAGEWERDPMVPPVIDGRGRCQVICESPRWRVSKMGGVVGIGPVGRSCDVVQRHFVGPWNVGPRLFGATSGCQFAIGWFGGKGVSHQNEHSGKRAHAEGWTSFRQNGRSRKQATTPHKRDREPRDAAHTVPAPNGAVKTIRRQIPQAMGKGWIRDIAQDSA